MVGAAQRAWTMDRCVSYALKHATEVRRQNIEQRQKRVDYRTALLDFLPQVSAQIGGQYSWGRNIDPETNTYNNVTTFNNNYSLSASMPLFDGGLTWNALRKARLTKNSSATAVQKALDDKAIDVMRKFVEAVYAVKSIGLMQAKLDDSQALLQKTRRLYELGEKSRPDVVQMESQVAEDDYNLLHQRNTARLALLSLKSAMNYPASDTLTLDTALTAEAAAVPRREAVDFTAIETGRRNSRSRRCCGPPRLEDAARHAAAVTLSRRRRVYELLQEPVKRHGRRRLPGADAQQSRRVCLPYFVNSDILTRLVAQR